MHCDVVKKAYVGVRYRVIAQVYKHHLALDKAPFYCTLFMLRCSTKSARVNQVTRYSRHRLAATEFGSTNDRRYLVENPHPAHVVLGRDFRESTSTESDKFDQDSELG